MEEQEQDGADVHLCGRRGDDRDLVCIGATLQTVLPGIDKPASPPEHSEENSCVTSHSFNGCFFGEEQQFWTIHLFSLITNGGTLVVLPFF